MNAPLPCIVTRDLRGYMRQQDAAEALERGRERAAASADAIQALQRLQDNDYTAYCALNNALVRQDSKRAGEILSAAFEAEVNVLAGEVLHG